MATVTATCLPLPIEALYASDAELLRIALHGPTTAVERHALRALRHASDGTLTDEAANE